MPDVTERPPNVSMTYVTKDAFTRLLCTDGVATPFELAVRKGILDRSGGPTKKVMGSLDALRHKLLRGSVTVADRLRIPIDELLGVCLYRVLQNGSLLAVPRDVAAFFQRVVDARLMELLPWQYLMSTERYENVIDLSIHKFGLTKTECSLATGYVDGVTTFTLADARLLYGPVAPPRPILASWCLRVGAIRTRSAHGPVTSIQCPSSASSQEAPPFFFTPGRPCPWGRCDGLS